MSGAGDAPEAPASELAGPGETAASPSQMQDLWLEGRLKEFELIFRDVGGLTRVAMLVDRRTQRAWILAGSSQSWQAITPVGVL